MPPPKEYYPNVKHQVTAQADLSHLIAQCGDCHPNPGPARAEGLGSARPVGWLGILQWNISKWSPAKLDAALSALRYEDRVSIVVLQEVLITAEKLDKNSPKYVGFSYPGWECVIKAASVDAHGNPRGGEAILVRSGCDELRPPKEVVAAAVDGNRVRELSVLIEYCGHKFIVTSAYSRPHSANCPMLLPDSTSSLIREGAQVICWDVNGHCDVWDANTAEDRRGVQVSEMMSDFDFHIINDNEAMTRVHSTVAHHNPTAPDIAAVRGYETSEIELIDVHGSDHLAMYFKIYLDDSDRHPIPRTKARYKWSRADWPLYREEVTKRIRMLKRTNSVDVMVRQLERIIIEAADIAVPKGRPLPPSAYKRYLKDPKYKELTAKLDSLCGDPEKHSEYFEVRRERSAFVDECRKKDLEDAVKGWDPDGKEMYSFTKALHKNCPRKGISSLEDEDRQTTSTTDRQIANTIARFQKKASGSGPKPPKVRIWKNPQGIVMADRISITEVRSSMSKVRLGKAPGPDGIAPELLKKLPDLGVSFLHRIIWKSYRTGQVPRTLRRGLLASLPKPNKPPNKPSSYRPVTLTSVIAKFAERIIAERLVFQIHPKLSKKQWGYRETRTTADAVAGMVDDILRTFTEEPYDDEDGTPVEPKPGVAVLALYDLTNAFPTVPWEGVMAKMSKMGVDRYTMRWIRNFLVDRPTWARVNNRRSYQYVCDAGVPQGTILGPIMWCIYINDLIEELQKVDNTTVEVYADDVSVASHGRTLSEAEATALKVNEVILKWATDNSMAISTKTEVATMKRSANQKVDAGDENGNVRLPVTLDQPAGPFFKSYDKSDPAKLLGTTIDPKLNFIPYVDAISKQVRMRLKQFRVVSSISTASTHMLRCLYLGYINPKFLYTCETYWPRLSEAQKDKLRRLQRRALRMVTGCVSSTPIESLHLEADVPSLDDQVDHLCLVRHEQKKRFPQGDPRYELANRHPPVEPEQSTTKVLRPVAVGQRLAASALAPEPTSREPVRVTTTIAPQDTMNAHRITFGVDVDSPVPKDEDLHDEVRKERKRTAVVETLRRLKRGLGKRQRHRFALQFWTDAAMKKVPGDQAKTSGVAIAKFKGKLINALTRRCGIHACSFRAEALTIEDTCSILLELVRSEPGWLKGKTVLIASDSQSTISALNRGPTNQKERMTQTTWEYLKQIADFGVRVHLQFVYSHCGVLLNEVADRVAGVANKKLKKPDLTPLWLTDVFSYSRRYIGYAREAKIQTKPRHREAVIGARPTVMDRKTSRGLQVQLAGLRTGESKLVGKFRRRLKLNLSMACRWCCPQHHPEPPPQPPPPEEPPPAGTTFSYKCPGPCGKIFTRRYVLIEHCKASAPGAKGRPKTCGGTQLPRWILDGHAEYQARWSDRDKGITPYMADNTVIVDSERLCKHCRTVKNPAHQHIAQCGANPEAMARLEARRNGEQRRVLEVPPELRSVDGCPDETFWHLLFDCPVLEELRQKHKELLDVKLPVFERSLLNNDPRFLAFIEDALGGLPSHMKSEVPQIEPPNL
ncbi:reverse transcriptase domain-containing protein [Methylophaga thiooxydans]|uniref:reverse transcriptase domain-containing protein n=1 Tax=Methylophaga thiooxydans TaxID=392484 RepID=UPI0023574B8F|nr:reverse transcriptase domain-containing protein [Methylophaga thiooxydans]